MRTSTAFFALALPTLLLASPESPLPAAAAGGEVEGGSLQKLLDRITAQSNKAIPVNTIPENLAAAADNTNQAVVQQNHPQQQAHSGVQAKRHKKLGEGRRWVWGTALIQDDTPTVGLPAVGSNANLLSGNARPVATPTAKLTPPTFPSKAPVVVPALAVAPVPAAAATTTPAVGVVAEVVADPPVSSSPKPRRTRPAQNPKATVASSAAVVPNPEEEGGVGGGGTGKKEKKWYWGPSIIQNGDPVPTFGFPGRNTPAYTPVAPTFPPLNPPAESVAAAASTTTPVVAYPEVSNLANPPVKSASGDVLELPTEAVVSYAPAASAFQADRAANRAQRAAAAKKKASQEIASASSTGGQMQRRVRRRPSEGALPDLD